MGKGASIGFHSAYQRDTGEVSGPGNAILGAYLDKIGLPEKAIYYIIEARPEGMTWLTLSDAESVGIDVELFESKKEPPSSNGALPLSTDELTIAGRLARNVGLRLTASMASLGQSIVECYKQATLKRKEESALYCISLDILSAELWSEKATVDQTAYAGIRQRTLESLSTLGEPYRADQLLERAALIADRARALLAEAQTAEKTKETTPLPAIGPATSIPAPIPATLPPSTGSPQSRGPGQTPAPATASTTPTSLPVTATPLAVPAQSPGAPAMVPGPSMIVPAPTQANTPQAPPPPPSATAPSPPAAAPAPIAAPAPPPPPAATVSTPRAPAPARPMAPAAAQTPSPPAPHQSAAPHRLQTPSPLEAYHPASSLHRQQARPPRPAKPHRNGCVPVGGAIFC